MTTNAGSGLNSICQHWINFLATDTAGGTERFHRKNVCVRRPTATPRVMNECCYSSSMIVAATWIMSHVCSFSCRLACHKESCLDPCICVVSYIWIYLWVQFSGFQFTKCFKKMWKRLYKRLNKMQAPSGCKMIWYWTSQLNETGGGGIIHSKIISHNTEDMSESDSHQSSTVSQRHTKPNQLIPYVFILFF